MAHTGSAREAGAGALPRAGRIAANGKTPVFERAPPDGQRVRRIGNVSAGFLLEVMLQVQRRAVRQKYLEGKVERLEEA